MPVYASIAQSMNAQAFSDAQTNSKDMAALKKYTKKIQYLLGLFTGSGSGGGDLERVG